MSRRLRILARNHPAASLAGLLLLGLSLGALGLGACSADSPSEPSQPPGTPPGTSPSTTWNITVTLSPSSVAAGSDDPVQVTVRVRRAGTNEPPPNGTTAVLSAGAGDFGTPGGGSSVVIQLVNGQAVVNYFPPETEGAVVIEARLEGSVGQATLQIGEPATFFLGSIQPSTGNPAGGEEVTIHGGGFESPVRVTFGGVPAQVLSVSPTSIRVVTPPFPDPVPAGQTRSVTVAVTVHLNEEDEATDALADAFIYTRGGVTQPAIISVTPTSGPNEGGTRVTLRGEGFQAPVQVFFGQGSADDFTGSEATVESVTPTQIVVISPPATGFGQDNRNSQVNILVKNLETGFSALASSAFTYGVSVVITAIRPNEVPENPTSSDLVTIFGHGFEDPLIVEVGSVQQGVISVTGTEIVFRPEPFRGDVACGVRSSGGNVSVTLINSGESAPPPLPVLFYTGPEQILLTGVAPDSGSQSGGTAVTISGQNFEPPLRVRFRAPEGGLFTGTVTSTSSTSVGASTPAVPNSVLDEDECDDNADGHPGMRFVRTAFDVLVENLETGCADVLDGAFTYVPSDQTCRGDVAPPEEEETECTDDFDNDGDGFIDEDDPECTGPDDDDESS